MLIPVRNRSNILPAYRGTPVERLLAGHALGETVPAEAAAEMAIVTCMDPRIDLRLPRARFAFVARTAGAAVEPVVFNLAAAVALAPVTALAVIGHSDCAMVKPERHRAVFISKMTGPDGGLTRAEAEEMFERGASRFGCDDAVTHSIEQAADLRKVFPGMIVAPLHYEVADGSLLQIDVAAAEEPPRG